MVGEKSGKCPGIFIIVISGNSADSVITRIQLKTKGLPPLSVFGQLLNSGQDVVHGLKLCFSTSPQCILGTATLASAFRVSSEALSYMLP